MGESFIFTVIKREKGALCLTIKERGAGFDVIHE